MVCFLLIIDKNLDIFIQPREECKIENSDASSKSYISELESFRSLAGDSDAELLKALIDQINSGSGEDCISPIVLSPSSDKARRTVSSDFHFYI